MLRLGLLPFALLAAPATAQDSTIVVTGRGLGEVAGEAVYGPVVLDRDRLTGSALGRLAEILKEVPGLRLFRRSDARSANPTTPGLTLSPPGGTAASRGWL